MVVHYINLKYGGGRPRLGSLAVLGKRGRCLGEMAQSDAPFSTTSQPLLLLRLMPSICLLLLLSHHRDLNRCDTQNRLFSWQRIKLRVRRRIFAKTARHNPVASAELQYHVQQTPKYIQRTIPRPPATSLPSISLACFLDTGPVNTQLANNEELISQTADHAEVSTNQAS